MYALLVSRDDQKFGPEITQRLVIDRTNLPGTFDFRLRWTADSQDASLSAALREQLGLTLESTWAASDVLVIDQIERPSLD